MRKFILGLLCGIIAATSVAVFASETIRLIVNGEDITGEMESRAQIINDVAYVPAIEFAAHLGFAAEFDEESNTITIKDSRFGFDDVITSIPEGDITARMVLTDAERTRSINVDAIIEMDELQTMITLFKLFAPEIASLMVVEDYIGWSEGAESMFANIWENLFVINAP